MRVIMLFIDGVGIGRRDAAVNPFFVADLPALKGMFDGDWPSLGRRVLRAPAASVIPLDANLGMPGLPQSGTGQTALFTGVNGAKIAGKHFGPYPYSTLRPLISTSNIFRRLLEAGKSPWFANAYPQRYFDYFEKRKSRTTVTAYSATESGMRLLRDNDLAEGRGISGDITGAAWAGLGYPEMPRLTPGEAGERLARLSGEHDFVLFEYWKTDHAGHAMSMAEAVEALQLIDGLVAGILNGIDRSSTMLFITSDHGNIEDLSVKTHTRNPVPGLAFGDRHEEFTRALMNSTTRGGSLIHVTPLLMKFIDGA